jgi:hypothetical protein
MNIYLVAQYDRMTHLAGGGEDDWRLYNRQAFGKPVDVAGPRRTAADRGSGLASKLFRPPQLASMIPVNDKPRLCRYIRQLKIANGD